MILNYIKLAWRGIKKDKLFSSINILGLSIGLAVTTLLLLYVFHERSFDNMYPKKDRICRLLLHTENDTGKEIWANVPPVSAKYFKDEIPEIESSARFLAYDFGKDAIVTIGDKYLIESKWVWADPEALTIFDIPFIQGHPEQALTKPKSIIISESTAQRYFNDTNAVGKIVKLNNKVSFEVTGVFKDFPSNSTFDYQVIGTAVGSWFDTRTEWGNASFQTFVLLSEGASMAKVKDKINTAFNKAIPESDQWYSFGIQALNDVHLYSADFKNSRNSRKGSIKEVKVLSGLALLILLIACINYTNLMTARSQKRSKDVGINKTLGASVNGLMWRFFIETGLITAIAMGIGIALAVASVPVFESITGRTIEVYTLFTFRFLGWLLAVWAMTSLLSGLYPALYLSKFSPREALKPTKTKNVANVFTRKGLVVLQFCASVVLIISVLVIQKQLQFMKAKDLGYNPEEVVILPVKGLDESTKNTLKSTLQALPEVNQVALSQGYPGYRVSGRSIFKDDQDEQGLPIHTNVADGTILDVLELKVLAGTSLPKMKAKTDTVVDVVLNKKAVDYLGLTPEEAIGKRVDMMLGENAYVRAVVDNFNYESLQQPIQGYAFHNLKYEGKKFLLLRFASNNISKSLQKFERIFKKVSNNFMFQYQFLDNNTQKLYAKEQQTANIGMAFSALAIFIACLGLFGLAAFTAEQRTKEIGVRKVLGASVLGITQLLSKDFVKLVLVAFVIAFPLAFWLMNNWLQNFAYRTSIGIVEFVVAGIASIGIALVTVSFHSIRAARANPVESLKTE